MLPVPLSIQFTPKNNTTSCICCSSNTAVLNQSNAPQPIPNTDLNRRMIPSSSGLIAEGDTKPSLFSCLDCFAEVRALRVNIEARRVFETYLTQQVGIDIANSVLTENKWTREGISLRQKDIEQLETEAKQIYKSTEAIAKNFKQREVLELVTRQPPSPQKSQSPSADRSRSSSVTSLSNSNRKKSDPQTPLVVSRSNRQVKEVFDPTKIASYIKEITPATQEQASTIADQIQLTFTYSHGNRPIESKDILSYLIEQLKQNNLPVNEPPPLSPRVSQYHHFNEIPIATLKELTGKKD